MYDAFLFLPRRRARVLALLISIDLVTQRHLFTFSLFFLISVWIRSSFLFPVACGHFSTACASADDVGLNCLRRV
ncbi:hypothetical protein BDU57DRAFT_230798 [Ampelomyces quisqualis]|uniref:Uncharacterized protein n=1 Tax=Ampelomyces quisqualis TaxID=50730 RepID=A0A6A5QQV0_AMPQU|nr:hypothetical protein BDU57DRAFT_230798 [Ampelomyces quisqualis]